MKPRSPEETLRCSFCHKSQDAVAKLISSPKDYPQAYICDACVAVCNSILKQDAGKTARTDLSHKKGWRHRVKSWWNYGIIKDIIFKYQ